MSFALFPYQRETVDQIVARKIGTGKPTYVAHEMGLGKTPIAIAVAQETGITRMGVFCPAVARLTWLKEVKRWWPHMAVTVIEKPNEIRRLSDTHTGVFIISYGLLSAGHVHTIAAALKVPFEMTVLDEAHYLKNGGAARTKAVLKVLKPLLGWCLPMSGTPAPNHQGELFPILNAFFPEATVGAMGRAMKQFEFENVYCRVVPKWFNGRQVRTIEGSQNIDVLREKLKGSFVRKTKREALPELPDMMFDTYPVSAPTAPPWRGKGRWQDLDDQDLLDEFKDMHIATMRQALGVAKVPGSVEAIIEYLDGCRRKVVVFAHHKEVVQGLMDGLVEYAPVKIDGGTSADDRARAVDAFLNNPGCRVFVGNIIAAGTAITLVGDNNDVSDVFFAEADTNPGNNVQAASRIHRIGQRNAVQVWFLTAYGTYDARIQELNARRAADFQATFG